MGSLKIKQGDTEQWTGTVTHAGAAPPLQGATAVVLYARPIAGAANQIDGVAVDTFDSAGNWTFTPLAAHVGTAVKLQVYLRATYAGGETRRFPSSGYSEVDLESYFE